MTRLWSSVVGVVVLVLVVATAPTVTPARAEGRGNAGAPAAAPFSPVTGALFNNPDDDSRWVILDQVARSVDSAPPGSVIRIAVYSFYQQELVDKLVAAHRRGVSVRVLVDGHRTTPQILQLRASLGTDTSAGSYATSCRQSCMSDKTSFMHAKMYLFSTAGTAKKVTMVGSGNPTLGGHSVGWNNHYTVVGNEELYRASVRYFHDMIRDRTGSYYRTTASDSYKLYFFPRAGRTVRSDTFYNLLSNVRCSGAAPGYGVDGRTVVRVAMYFWTYMRVDIARLLSRLQEQGCAVQVVTTTRLMDQRVSAALLRKTRRGRVALYDGARDRDRDGVYESYVHSKYILVDGVYGNDRGAKLVWTGSANFGGPSLREGNEVTLRIARDSVHRQFNGNFIQLREISTPVTTVPPKSASLNGLPPGSLDAGEAGGDDFWVDDDLGRGDG